MKQANSKLKRATMNHTYRLIWSDAKQMFIPVAEEQPQKVSLMLPSLLRLCCLGVL